jgi:hypothetical protein
VTAVKFQPKRAPDTELVDMAYAVSGGVRMARASDGVAAVAVVGPRRVPDDHLILFALARLDQHWEDVRRERRHRIRVKGGGRRTRRLARKL